MHTFLFFLVVAVGLLLGKVKIGNISLGLSAVLIISVLLGYLITLFCPNFVNADLESCMGLFSKFGTALFMASIGLLTGMSAAKVFTKRNIMFFTIGVFMVCTGFFIMNIISYVDKTVNRSIIVGILCGAMTSTPGLSAACESKKIISDLAVLGYGYTYFFGVLGVMMFVQIMHNKKIIIKTNTFPEKQNAISRGSDLDFFIPVSVSVIFGYIAGTVKIPYIDFSFGTSGGILCSAFLIGIAVQRLNKKNVYENNSLNFFRNFGLLLFFVGNGIPAGIRINMTPEIKWFIYGSIMTVSPMLSGYLCSRYILRRESDDCLCVVAGGMTSTPAIGIMLEKTDTPIDLSVYSMTYMGALLTMTIGMRFI